jgi:hypothetical protein
MFVVGIHNEGVAADERDVVLFYASTEDEAIDWAQHHPNCLPKLNGDSIYAIHGGRREGRLDPHDIYVNRGGDVLSRPPFHLLNSINSDGS